jgi:hypothetical protein
MRFLCSSLQGAEGKARVARPRPVAPHGYESKREPPHPDPFLHKYLEEREMERRARVLGIHARNSSANSLPQKRKRTCAVRGRSNRIRVWSGQWSVLSGERLVAEAGGGKRLGQTPHLLTICLRVRPKGACVWTGESRRRDADGGGRDDRAPLNPRLASNPVKPERV